MRHFLLPLLIAMALCLASCVDYTEDTTLRADGSATLNVAMSMKDVFGKFGRDDDTGAIDGEQTFDDGSGKTWTEHKSGLVVRHIDGIVKDWRSSPTLGPAHTGLGKLEPQWYTVTPLGLGRYRLQRTVKAPGAAEAQADAGSTAGDNGSPLTKLGESFSRMPNDNLQAGHEFSVTIHAPLILSSNADVKDGMTGATWKRPLNKLVGPGAAPLTIDVTVLLINYALVGGIAGGVVLVLILWAVLAARGRQRRTGMSNMPTSV